MKVNEVVEATISVIYLALLIMYITQLFYRPAHYYGSRVRNRFNGRHWKRAAKAFGIRVNKLKKMSKDEIKKAYREKAKKNHPDHGGNAEDFNNLSEAYQFAYAAAS
jgi:hypothetical protein